MPHTDTVSEADLAHAERQALQRPRPSAMWDERLYTSHGVTFSWAERGDDLRAESNYLTALRILRHAAGEHADEQIIDATISDWLVGSLRQIFVRIRDNNGTYTTAFRTAVGLALALRDYPLLDDSDYSERECAAYNAALDETLWRASCVYELDSDDERTAITEHTLDTLSDSNWTSPDDIHTDQIAEHYHTARDRYFTDQARAYLVDYRALLRPGDGRGWPGPGQLDLCEPS